MSISVTNIVGSINDFLAANGLEGVIRADATGTRAPGANLRFEGTGYTEISGSPTTSIFNLDSGSWPVWRGIGDILAVGGKRYRLTSFSSGQPRFSGLPTGLPSQAFVLYRAARLSIAGNVSFRLSGAGAEALGLPTGQWNTLGGTDGVRVTDRVYYVEGYDLRACGVQRGDLLVLNNGESFRIDRVLDDGTDPRGYQRVLLFDRTPADTSPEWSIPSAIRSAEVDYERNGAYPGDLAQAEIFEASTGKIIFGNSVVVAQKERQLAVHFGLEVRAGLLAGDEIRLTGVKHRKALRLPSDILSIPTLQTIVPEKLAPVRYREHVDFVLEPFYRDTGARPLPMLQFANSVFIDSDIEPPDVLWAEVTVFDNEVHVENLFGRLVNFLRDDAASFPKDFSYVAGVAGLLYAQQRGPNIFAMSVGAQILLGQPFAEAAGYVEEIRANYSPYQGRILLRDADGNVPTQSETVRAYYYKKDPADLSPTSGLAENQETGLPWTAGDYVPQFAPLGAGITLEDIYENPRWWRPYVGAGSMHEVEKFHRFACTFNLEVVDLANISLLFSLLMRIKPTYTKALLVGAHGISDDIDPDDDFTYTATLDPYDTLLGAYGYRYDDYRGDGTLSHAYDDGVTRFDALVDSIVDLIEFEMTIDWPGGVLTFPNTWPFDEDMPVIDVDGAETGTPGQSFSVTDGMDLAAGTYRTTRGIKTGPILPPL